MFVLCISANIPMIRSVIRRVANIESSAPASYPLQSTPKGNRKSLGGNTNDRYFTLENGLNTENSVSVSRGIGRDDVDRMYPLTRNDSPPMGMHETGSEEGIMKETKFTLSYSQAR